MRVSLTGGEDPGKHPALGVAHWIPGTSVFRENFWATRPFAGIGAQIIGVTPVPYHHTGIILGVQLRAGGWIGGVAE